MVSSGSFTSSFTKTRVQRFLKIYVPLPTNTLQAAYRFIGIAGPEIALKTVRVNEFNERRKNMRKLILGTICLGVLSLWSTANANTINVTMSLPLGAGSSLVNDVSAQDVPGGGLSDVTVFAWLQSDINTFNSNFNGNLPSPTTGLTAFDNLSSGPTIQVDAGDYLVLHYGRGRGGLGQGGGLVALYFDAAGTYVAPDNGSGPNGNGGISFARLWDHGTQVPDGGTSSVLLGMALSALGLVHRRVQS